MGESANRFGALSLQAGSSEDGFSPFGVKFKLAIFAFFHVDLYIRRDLPLKAGLGHWLWFGAVTKTAAFLRVRDRCITGPTSPAVGGCIDLSQALRVDGIPEIGVLVVTQDLLWFAESTSGFGSGHLSKWVCPFPRRLSFL